MRKPTRLFSGLRCAFLGASLASSLLAACEGRVATHGDAIDPIDLARLVPAQSTRADVVSLLGSPSSVALFDDRTWYYISDRERTLAFLAPETLERQVVALTFNDQGLLQSIDAFGIERGQEVELVSRETPSFGQSPTVIQQMLGNLGRFNREDTQRR